MKWIPLDGYHQKPKRLEIVILSDGVDIYQDMIWLDSFTHEGRDYKEGWYHVNATEPSNVKPTHYLMLELPK